MCLDYTRGNRDTRLAVYALCVHFDTRLTSTVIDAHMRGILRAEAVAKSSIVAKCNIKCLILRQYAAARSRVNESSPEKMASRFSPMIPTVYVDSGVHICPPLTALGMESAMCCGVRLVELKRIMKNKNKITNQVGLLDLRK